jgi:hypothetical protein
VSVPLVVSDGGGTNSVAVLVGLHQHGERPDAIVFADTGGEKPHTYEHLWLMQEWCERVGFPSIQIVRGDQPQQRKDGTLEQECLRLGALPSKSYGFGTCSQKWKIDPYKRWEKRWMAERGLTDRPVKAIGFHAGEPERAARVAEAERPFQRYPLIEWDWDYDDCKDVILAAGLPLPGKSACFFCPSTRKVEILELRERYPDLLARALEIERRAMAGEGQAEAARVGLGRRLVWRDFLLAPQTGDGVSTPELCAESCFT